MDLFKTHLKKIFIYSGLISLLLLFLIWKACNNSDNDNNMQADVTDDIVISETGKGNIVQAQMKNVAFHIDTGIVLHIKDLRGRLIAKSKNGFPMFDKKDSYILEINSAVITMDMQSLSNLLNNYVFGYEDSPLENLEISTEGDKLIQKGNMKNIPFKMLSELTVTKDGKIKIHPLEIEVIGIEVQGLMKFFEVELDNIITANKKFGASIENNDLYLDPALMLPPPRIKGHLREIVIGENQITQIFSSNKLPSLKPDSANTNYMYFFDGRLRFGKLTMYTADMQIIDDDLKDPFDFFLDQYFEQLTAGYHKTSLDDGLLIWMPDYNDMKNKAVK